MVHSRFLRLKIHKELYGRLTIRILSFASRCSREPFSQVFRNAGPNRNGPVIFASIPSRSPGRVAHSEGVAPIALWRERTKFARIPPNHNRLKTQQLALVVARATPSLAFCQSNNATPPSCHRRVRKYRRLYYQRSFAWLRLANEHK
jgi:hypothetical protein